MCRMLAQASYFSDEAGSDASPHPHWKEVCLALFLAGCDLSRQWQNLFWINK
ncbi:hypothetical protein [Aeromonas enteropelogenes]|uniref:hypothetical protein n=1 Tax=Aeromonas enteropelogenes TaxID=29489 RepID=UPI003B9EBD44